MRTFLFLWSFLLYFPSIFDVGRAFHHYKSPNPGEYDSGLDPYSNPYEGTVVYSQSYEPTTSESSGYWYQKDKYSPYQSGDNSYPYIKDSVGSYPFPNYPESLSSSYPPYQQAVYQNADNPYPYIKDPISSYSYLPEYPESSSYPPYQGVPYPNADNPYLKNSMSSYPYLPDYSESSSYPPYQDVPYPFTPEQASPYHYPGNNPYFADPSYEAENSYQHQYPDHSSSSSYPPSHASAKYPPPKKSSYHETPGYVDSTKNGYELEEEVEKYEESYGSYDNYESYEYEYYGGHEVLDNKGRYLLQWEVDYAGKTITFNITILNKGWVALGLSKDGTMKNADIMIGGVKGGAHGGGQPFIGDYYSDLERRLYSDVHQDWNLVYAEEVDGITHLQISRMLDTCDLSDYPITEDLVHIIWAYGETDDYDYHFDKRGNFRVYLLDPVVRTYEQHLMTWRVSREVEFEKETLYHCSIHKAPHMLHKNHIVEVHPYLADENSAKRAHHMLLWKCVAPAGMDAKDIFEPLLDYPGEDCDFAESHVIPVLLCKNLITGLAIGGKPYILPYSVGLPVGEDFHEFWMLEVHYNNPDKIPITLEAGFDLYFTNKLRQNDGQALLVAYDLFGLFMIPPISTNFEVYGICTPECTHEMFPPEGIEIVSVLLHSHYSGKKLKLQHFRYGEELPVIMKDDNYDPSFQQWHNLYEPRVVLPGDQLVMTCEYDDTWTNVTTLNGFATREEMCLAGLTINKRIPYFSCLSQVSQDLILNLIGVQDYEWDIPSYERVVTKPRSLEGLLLSEVADSHDWTKTLRYQMQSIQTYTIQNGTCPQILIRDQEPTLTSTDSIQEIKHGNPVSSLKHNSNQKSLTSAQIKKMQQKLQGTVISSDADPSDIVTLAKGYGDTTLMGGNQGVPKKTPGSQYHAVYPHNAKKYMPERYCADSVFSNFYNSPIEVPPSSSYQSYPTSYQSAGASTGGAEKVYSQPYY